MSSSALRRLAGEKETVVVVLGGGVGGFRDCERAEPEVVARGLGLGAKKREITSCLCLPMAVFW